MAGKHNFPKRVGTSVNYTSILVIDKKGRLLRLNCPFQVMLKVVKPTTSVPQTFNVDAVRQSDDVLMEYLIQSKPYPYFLFVILLG